MALWSNELFSPFRSSYLLASSVSRSPSPLTPATPGSPVPQATFEEDEKSKFGEVGDPADLRLDPNVPGGCVELYAQGGDVQGGALVVTP